MFVHRLWRQVTQNPAHLHQRLPHHSSEASGFHFADISIYFITVFCKGVPTFPYLFLFQLSLERFGFFFFFPERDESKSVISSVSVAGGFQVCGAWNVELEIPSLLL